MIMSQSGCGQSLQCHGVDRVMTVSWCGQCHGVVSYSCIDLTMAWTHEQITKWDYSITDQRMELTHALITEWGRLML